MGNVLKTSVATMTPTQVATVALGALAGNLQLAAVADRNWEPMFATMGETVDVPIRGAVTANDKAADTDVTLQAPSSTKVSIVLNKHKEASFVFEDIAKAFANQDVMQGYASDAAIVLAEAVEIAGFVEAYTNFTTNADIGAQQVDVSDDIVLQARKVVKDAKIPKNAEVWFFLSTKDMLALLQLDKFSRADALGDGGQMMANAPMGFKKYGMNFVESQYVQVVANLTHNLVLAPKQGLALANRPLPLPPEKGVISADVIGGEDGTAAMGLGIRMLQVYQGLKLGTQLTLDVLFGWKVIRGAFGLDVNA
jgi:hypothetical protein